MKAKGSNLSLKIMAAPFDQMNGYGLGLVMPHFRSVPYKASFEMNATKFQVCKPFGY